MYQFNAEQAANACIEWIRRFFDENGKDCNAVLGISGGKDSTVSAALCARALGPDRVIGVLMPNGEQADIDMSLLLVKHLGIPYVIVNIKDAFDGALAAIKRLEDLYERVKLYGLEKYVSFDLGMLSMYKYYTGVIIKAYTF